MDRKVLVGEEVVSTDSYINSLQEGAGQIDALTPKGNFEARPHLSSRILIARNHHGANSPAGHGCSNLNEQLLALPSYTVPAWATHPTQTLGARMAWQADRLADLSSPSPKGDQA